VLPLSVFQRVDPAALEHVRGHAEVPVWIPDPLPPGWALCGLGAVADTRRRLRATVTAFRGPAPLGGDGEWLMVAEEPGIGLGAGYAGIRTEGLPRSASDTSPARIQAEGHATPLWAVLDSDPDRSVYVGEAEGVWLWLIGFPSDAGYAVLEDLTLTDLRSRPPAVLTPTALSGRLRPSRSG
jgi:hypothetical protein